MSDRQSEILEHAPGDPQALLDGVAGEVEPTKEQVLESIRIGVRQALMGETAPFEELIEEVRREMESNDDAGEDQQALQ